MPLVSEGVEVKNRRGMKAPVEVVRIRLVSSLKTGDRFQVLKEARHQKGRACEPSSTSLSLYFLDAGKRIVIQPSRGLEETANPKEDEDPPPEKTLLTHVHGFRSNKHFGTADN